MNNTGAIESNTGLRLSRAPKSPDIARKVHAWRSDPLTQAMFFNSFNIAEDEFYERFTTDYFRDPDLYPAIGTDWNNECVVFIAFKRIDDKPGLGRCADISINVSPERRGQGIGTDALKLVPAYLSESPIDTVIAVIKTNNTASINAFKRAGFTYRRTRNQEIQQTGEILEVNELVLSLTKVK